MMKRFAEGASRIFLACGFTDFRKQIPGLVATVTLNFKLDPYNSSYVFIFCNRRKDSIKVLRYDYNGFVLATKKLLDDMKFQWPRTPDEVKEITFQQVEWLLQGLEIDQKKAHHQVKIDHKNGCF
ncbi:IS66 family insertion sequence element accessory protein TnpB [Blautia obeum]|uniref:Transposase n=1 Tax=Blautia obeum TaxID=40520 RepID=A0A367FUQ5_9FIRM|nr:IS66 family insertion sequence element accessory protein TnpB [Blautia obeum]RCH41556.1 IS66 family insertion sequence hypothetical protein [Blautia obeum]